MRRTLHISCRRTFALVILAIGLGVTTDRQSAIGQTSSATTPAARAPSDPVLLAHRGLARHAPENTLPAFAAAIALELAIELDVYQTRDGNLVVIHDPTVNRTTNGSGRVSDMTLDEIRKLDAGQWFHARFSGLKIPTLDEVLRLIREKQRRPVWIAINMKVISAGIEEKIVRLVEKHDLLKQVFAFGQPPESSRRFKLANPQLKTTVVKIYDSDHLNRTLTNPLADCLWVGFIPSRQQVDRVHRLGKHIWLSLQISQKRPDIWDQARASQLDGICTGLAFGVPLALAIAKVNQAPATRQRPAPIPARHLTGVLV